MTPLQSLTPPLSPVLLAGIPLRGLSPQLLRPALAVAMATMRRCHPAIFERLAELGDPLFVIDPVDLPLVFLLRPGGASPSLTAARDEEGIEATASIRGPLAVLIDLLEGRLDGDALFFTRDLVVKGDTEAVLMLRNAVDSDEVNLMGDILSMIGPLAGPARATAKRVQTIFAWFARDLETLRGAVIEPAVRRTENQALALETLDRKVDQAMQKIRGRGRPSS